MAVPERRMQPWFGGPRTGASGTVMLLLAVSMVALALLFAAMVQAQGVAPQFTPIPAQTARVMDTAAMLTPQQRADLEARLAAYEQARGTQIAVLTVPGTAPEVIEQYGIRVAEAWKTGRKGISDGAIIIIAPQNPPELRRIRIEVGYGLEGAIPDAIAGRIINEDMAPRFRQNDYYGGLVAAVDRIRAVLENEPLPPPVPTAPDGAAVSGLWPSLLFLLFMGMVILMTAMRERRFAHLAGRRGGSLTGPAVIGGLLGGILAGQGSSGRHGGFGGGDASGNW